MAKQINVKVFFYLRTNYKNRFGKNAIMVKIGINGKWKSIGSTGIYLFKEEWDSFNKKVKGKSQHASNTNMKLIFIENELLEIAAELPMRDDYLNKIKDIYTGRALRNSASFFQYFDKFLTNLKAQIGKEITQATYQKYLVTRKHLADFLQENRGRKDIAPGELDLMMINDFDSYLRTELSMQQNSATKTVRFLKTVVLFMIRCGAIERDPFANYRFRWKQVSRSFLSEEELKSIMERKMVTPRLEAVRDIFIFSCFTGMSYIDIDNLKESNIVTMNGERWISILRHKTGVSCHIPLLEVPQKILQKYEGKDKKGRLLPILSNQKMNAYLKEIANVCGIEKKVTFHVGRHTFATMTYNMGVSIETVSRMLGHKDIETTQIYARLLTSRISEEMNRISNRLNRFTNS